MLAKFSAKSCKEQQRYISGSPEHLRLHDGPCYDVMTRQL
jgi:hypothetical protein